MVLQATEVQNLFHLQQERQRVAFIFYFGTSFYKKYSSITFIDSIPIIMFHTVIGVYGVSGSGKSHALKGIQKVRPEWRCLDGSSIIEEVLKSQGKGLCDFGAMDEQQKIVVRNNAIQMVQSYSGLTLIAGHASFPDDSSKTMSDVTFNNVFTKGDAQTYRAILYLDRDPEQIFQQRKADNDTKKKHRDCLSVENLQDWIHHEKELLRRICKDSGIDFGLVKNENDIVEYIVNHILPPLVQEVQNKSEQALSLVIHQAIPLADVYLLLDGDRTLSPNDTSKTFFESLTANDLSSNDFPLKQIFTRYPDYTFQAFLEVAMLYGCCTSHAEYKRLSHDVGTNKVQLHQAWIDFLTKLPPNVHPIIVSSGNREIWSDTLQNLLSTTQISIIAGNHIGLHPYIIDSKAKAIVVTELRQRRKGCKIFSFGDSGTLILYHFRAI